MERAASIFYISKNNVKKKKEKGGDLCSFGFVQAQLRLVSHSPSSLIRIVRFLYEQINIFVDTNMELVLPSKNLHLNFSWNFN